MSTYDFSRNPDLVQSNAIKNLLKQKAGSFSELIQSPYYEKLYWFKSTATKSNVITSLREQYRLYLFSQSPYTAVIGKRNWQKKNAY